MPDRTARWHFGFTVLVALTAAGWMLALRQAGALRPLPWLTGWGVALLAIGLLRAIELVAAPSETQRRITAILLCLLTLLVTQWSGTDSLLQACGLIALVLGLELLPAAHQPTSLEPDLTAGDREPAAREQAQDEPVDPNCETPDAPSVDSREEPFVASKQLLPAPFQGETLPAVETQHELLNESQIFAGGFETEQEADAASEPQSGLDPFSSQAQQWSTRRKTADSRESIEGWSRVQLASKQKSITIHIPFVPPFVSTPEIECETLDDDGQLQLRVAGIWSYGARIELRRANPGTARQVTIGYYITGPSAADEAA